ncbi:MAG: CIA30 family protein [Gammaproteobacteria bacterium]|nr:CIA30 family protein [Gammaproteobacteria bacterium]
MNILTSASADDGYLQVHTDDWRLITDSVMGGVSEGKVLTDKRHGKECTVLSGDVSTDNNGGFIQIVVDVDETLAEKASTYDGVRIHVLGNGETYNLHLRTRDLWFPWQSYRSTFDTGSEWQQVELPFDRFEAYKTSARLDVGRLKRIGIVAIGRKFPADICVASVGFYRLSGVNKAN